MPKSFFQSSLQKANLGQKSRKKGYILSSRNLKRVLFSPPVTTRIGSDFDNRFLTWVPSLTCDPPRDGSWVIYFGMMDRG
jgi:hypothetical protein